MNSPIILGFVPAYHTSAHYKKERNSSPIIGPHLIHTLQSPYTVWTYNIFTYCKWCLIGWCLSKTGCDSSTKLWLCSGISSKCLVYDKEINASPIIGPHLIYTLQSPYTVWTFNTYTYCKWCLIGWFLSKTGYDSPK